jgi:cell division protease FtsH
MEIEDRFGHWRSERVGDLIWTLGAMAAEHVFYGQNTTGVGGDVHSTTYHAVRMVGRHAMGPTRVDLSDRIEDPKRRAKEEKRAMKRFEELGNQIMHRSGGSMLEDDGLSGVQSDGEKRRLAAGLIGQAFVVAYCSVKHNRAGVEMVADRLVAAGELYGDAVVDLLEEAQLERPEIDVLDEETWPRI